MCVRLTDMAVCRVLLANGATMRKRNGEYRVTLSDVSLSIADREAMASYTSDLDDALATGLAMAAWWAVKRSAALSAAVEARRPFAYRVAWVDVARPHSQPESLTNDADMAVRTFNALAESGVEVVLYAMDEHGRWAAQMQRSGEAERWALVDELHSDAEANALEGGAL